MKGGYIPPRITFERTAYGNYDIFYDKRVLVGKLSARGYKVLFIPEDLDGVSLSTLKIVIDKMIWLEAQIMEDNTRHF